MSAEDRARIEELPFVAWLGELPGHFKVPPGLAKRAQGDGQPTPSPTKIRIILHPDEPHTRALAALQGLPTTATPSGKNGAWRMEVTVPPGRLASTLSALANLPEVEAIEEARPVILHNQDGVWVHQSFVGPSPQETPIFDAGIFGCGETIAVADTGQDFDACQFSDPAGPPLISVCTTPPCPAAATDPTLRMVVKSIRGRRPRGRYQAPMRLTNAPWWS